MVRKRRSAQAAGAVDGDGDVVRLPVHSKAHRSDGPVELIWHFVLSDSAGCSTPMLGEFEAASSRPIAGDAEFANQDLLQKAGHTLYTCVG